MRDIMVEEVEMTLDEAIEYVRNNVEVKDILEISYSRIFAPGEGLRVAMQLTGKILNQSIEVDFNEIGEDLIEMRHVHDGKEIVIELL